MNSNLSKYSGLTSLHHLLAVIVWGAAAANLAAGDVEVEKHTFYGNPLHSYITDFSRCPFDGSNAIVILAQSQGVLLNEQSAVFKEFNFTLCSNMKVARIRDDRCIIYCGGGGFSPVYAADLDGQKLWKFDNPSLVQTVAHDGEGKFYVCMAKGVTILDQDGKILRKIDDQIYDIAFVTQSNVLTISTTSLKSRDRQLDIRDGDLKIRRRIPIDRYGRNIVAYQWPETKSVCYVTKDELVVIDQAGKTTKRVGLGDVVVGVDSALVQDDAGNDYLALLAVYKPGKASAKLFILSDQLETVYEESLPISFAVSTLGTTNRLYVGVGAAGVVEYRLRQKRSPMIR